MRIFIKQASILSKDKVPSYINATLIPILSPALPDCRYVVQNDVMVVSMDSLEFANIQSDCESLCDKSRIMNCRAYTFDPLEKR